MLIACVDSFFIPEAGRGMAGPGRGLGTFMREGLSLPRRNRQLWRIALNYMLTTRQPFVASITVYTRRAPKRADSPHAGWQRGAILTDPRLLPH